MKLRRLRLRLAVLFGLVAAALAIGPLLLWRSERVDAIERDFELGLIEQMEDLQRVVISDGDRSQIGFPAWFVNGNEEWIDEFSESGLEPPLFTWVDQAGDWPSFRSFSVDDSQYLGYITPFRNGEALVTLRYANDLDDERGSINSRTWLWVFLLSGAALGLGWWGAGLALGPTRRVMDDQQGFLADAAHEMRTPLAVITASSSQALARPRNEQEYVRSLSEIRSAAERASTGVNELLDLVRFDSGQAIPRLAPLRLDLLAEEVAASVRSDESTVIAEPTEAVVVDADLALVRQAIDNVVRNAVRRANTVELTSRTNGRFGYVEVADDGPGFDPEVLPRVFERYQRGDRRGEVGIGLAIVKAIVESNGGTVVAANRSEGGAVITIGLPLAE